MTDRPGVVALFLATLLGLGLVATRAYRRGSDTTPLLFQPTVRVLWALGLYPVFFVLAFGTYSQLSLSPKTENMAPWASIALFVVLMLGHLVGARNLRKEKTIYLPGFVRGIPWVLSFFLGVAFVFLTKAALDLPVIKGMRYVRTHEFIRFGALGTGVTFLTGVLAALLPFVLDALEKLKFSFFVGARHVRASKGGFLTVISVLSICGVAVSSCALCSVVSIMGGFGQDLKRKILGNNAHIAVDMPANVAGFEDSKAMLERLRKVRGVVAVTPIAGGEAMASSNASTAGAMVRGIDPDTIGDVIDLVKNIEYGRMEFLVDETKILDMPADEPAGSIAPNDPYRKPLADPFGKLDPAVRAALRPTVYPGIVIGRELARNLHLMVGDEVTMVSPMGELGPMGVLPRSRKFRVAAIFYSGMYEYDATHVYLRMDVAQKFFSLDDRVTGIDLKVADAESTEALLPSVKEAVENPKLRVRDWREMNKSLFSALKLERVATFVILSIAIAVASFCIICTLLLMVAEKAKEIAILKAIGASDRSIVSIFMTEGLVIGGIGTAFGVSIGVATCLGLRWFGVRLDPDVYYIDKLPVATNASDYVIVAVSAMAICLVATIYPAFAAASVRPVDGLRYE